MSMHVFVFLLLLLHFSSQMSPHELFFSIIVLFYGLASVSDSPLSHFLKLWEELSLCSCGVFAASLLGFPSFQMLLGSFCCRCMGTVLSIVVIVHGRRLSNIRSDVLASWICPSILVTSSTGPGCINGKSCILRAFYYYIRIVH